MELREIPLEKIKLVNNQPRREFREEGLAALGRSIEEIGQIQPVIVKPGQGNYILIAGERRIRALRDKGKKTVWAMVVRENMERERVRLIQLAENLQRENLNPLERAIAIKDYIGEEELSKKEASRRLGIPRTTINDWLNILEVGQFYQKKVLENYYGEDSPLTLSHISLANSLDKNTEDPTKKNQLLDYILKYNLSRGETRKIVDIFRKNPVIPLEEIVAGILITREQKKINREEAEKEGREPGYEELEKAFNRLEGILTKIMDSKHEILTEKKEDIIAEFKYLESLLEQAIPGGVTGEKKS